MNKFKYPKTVEEFNKLTPEIQGSLWPRCKQCKHIAQAHDYHANEGKEISACCEMTHGQCPTCKNHYAKFPCQCKGYDGPVDVEALIEYLNKEN